MDLIFHGVGESVLKFNDGSFVVIDSAQDLSIASSATTVEVEGGDSLYALADFVSKKSDKLTITNAVLNLETIKAQTGAEITAGSEVLFSDKKTIATAGCTLSQTTGIVVDSVAAQVVNADGTKTPLSNIGATGTPTATQFTVTAAGVVKVDTTLNDKVVEFSGYYTDANGQVAKLLETTLPKVCEFRHTLLSEESNEDGKQYRIDVRAFKCKPSGAFTYDAKKGTAYAPKLEFSILNPKRTDKRVLDYNVTVVE